MAKSRYIFLFLLLSSGCILGFFLYKYEKKTVFDSSLAPFYQILGKPVMQMSKVLSKTLPVDSIDEATYGEAIRERYKHLKDPKNPISTYPQEVLNSLSFTSNKGFTYTVYVLDSYSPNAFALPGGVLFITTGLLNLLESESELISILGHEIGHVEKSHCFDQVKFELLAKKVGVEPLGKLADLAFGIAIGISYNKTQEDEADDYSFDLLKISSYDPAGLGSAFEKLEQAGSGSDSKNADVLREYFQSHPYTELRKEKFTEKAVVWWKLHPKEKRYIGKVNIQNHVPKLEKEYESEWKEMQ